MRSRHSCSAGESWSSEDGELLRGVGRGSDGCAGVGRELGVVCGTVGAGESEGEGVRVPEGVWSFVKMALARGFGVWNSVMFVGLDDVACTAVSLRLREW